MRLRDRLALLTPAEAPPEPALLVASEDAARAERIARLRALIGEVAGREPKRTAPARVLRHEPQALPFGALHETKDGPLCMVERWLEPEHAHGKVRVNDALAVDSQLVSLLALDPALERIDLARMLILDTETTGLAGGTGTVPFLIGLAFFEDGALKLEQLFLRNLGAETPLLRQLAHRLSQASCIVSYNGKAFDWPLLRARFILNRIPLPEPPPHLDLLHCARRLWKRRLESLRLGSVEQALLGFHRQDDIDGSQIPGRYLGYLRGADPSTLLPVLSHNELDLTALAAVLWRACAHFERVRAADDPRDHLAYARVALRARDLPRAQAFAEAAHHGSEGPALGHEALCMLASIARVRGEYAAAAETLRQALELAPDDAAAARVHLALSRMYEHKLFDLARAYAHARMTADAEGEHAHGRRLGRLHRRLERAADA